MKRVWIPCILFLFFLPFNAAGQSCAILSKANSIVPDQFCSPVEVDWDVTYVGVNNAGTTVEIHYDWDDGSEETITATESPAGTFATTATHTYTSQDDRCNYHPIATLIVDGVTCTSSSQEQIVTIWDDEDSNGGEVNAEPDVFPICIGNGATMQFDDGSLYNCVPPQENDVPNETTRWFQWIYGTSNNMSGTAVKVDGIVRTYPFEGPMDSLPGPPAKVWGPNSKSLPITVGDDNQIGEEFEVELRYWNYCKPYPGPYVYDRSVIRIVDLPDATITPVDTLCEFNNSILLSAATGGGTWSGNGIINAVTGEFAPYVARPGTHEIKYEITDGNLCTDVDSIDIFVRDAPDGSITPVDPFCIYDAPYDLEASTALGTWSGNGITNVNTGIFDPAVAGIGTHSIAFVTDPDEYGCFGTDTLDVHVMNIPMAEFLTPDSAWCEQINNQSTADILITGTDSSTFDLIIEIRGTLDTLINLPNDTISIFLNNQSGTNTYALVKIIEHHDNNSCETDLSDTLIMDVNPLPVMNLSTNYDGFCSPVEMNFEAVAGYNTYTWDFGDGKSRVTDTHLTTHTYKFDITDNILSIVEGDTIYDFSKTDTLYAIQLVVETIHGCSATISDSIRVHANPAANFFVTPEIQNHPDSVIFLINLSSIGNWSYEWDFGDATGDNVKDPNQHIYDVWGIYDIELKVFSPFCRDSITQRVQILPPQPNALFEPDSIGCPPLEITFSNTSEYADSYVWDFDDGTFSTERNPSHIFYQSKEHHVKLAAFGLSGSDTTEQIVYIYERPQAVFNAYPTEAKNLKQLFKFVNNSINASYYLWDFGDGNTSPDENPSHIYGVEGTYDVTLYVWSENDCPDTIVRESLITVIAGEGQMEFPNAFVWNGTGPSGGGWTEGTIDNTVFHPNVINAVEFRMAIYTRWGEMIWETETLYIGWDGYLKSGELASPGVYVYKAFVTYISGAKEVLTGDVTFLH
ncbi:MAG: PKD domain-containing protein [Bacteroidales bacterium]|nr:PKD domain-containing protein [Bacteroidales bacterium]